MPAESDIFAFLTATTLLLFTSAQFVYATHTGTGLPLPEVKTCGDNTRFGEVATLTGDMLPRAGRITIRRCGLPDCEVVDWEHGGCETGVKLVADNWSIENNSVEHTCIPKSDMKMK